MEFLRSFWELFSRAVVSLWALATGVLAGVAVVLERVSPHARIPDGLWWWIVGGGAVVSVAWAYHRTRLEREAAHATDVRPDHLQELQHRLAVLLRNVEMGGGCEYEDIGYSTVNQAAFKAHYPGLEQLVDEWDATVSRVVTARQTVTNMLQNAVDTNDETDPWYGITSQTYDVAQVLSLIGDTVVSRSVKGTLDDPITFGWRETPPFPPHGAQPDSDAFWKLELGDHHVAVVSDVPAEDRAERTTATKKRVEALWDAARQWESSRDVGPAKDALREQQPVLQEEILHWQKASGVRVTRRCSICRKNEGWPEPELTLWQRVRVRLAKSWKCVRDRLPW